MGESILDAAAPANPNLEDKMEETAPSNPFLEVSVSFGRFENDSLSWEKWSTFSPNKYLEEVEKCATPGSVAKKAAFFEAHYKKIAARKAELLDQEKQMENDSSIVDNQTCGDLMGDSCNNNSESDLSDCKKSNEVVYRETRVPNEVRGTLVDELSVDAACVVEFQNLSFEGLKEEESRLDCQRSNEVVYGETSLANEVMETLVDQPSVDAASKAECKSTLIEGMKEEESRSDSPTLDKPKEAVDASAKEEVGNTSMGIEIVKELQEKEMEHTSNVKEENVKLGLPKDSNKIELVNKERNNSRIKKKHAPPIAKASPMAKSSPLTKSLPVAKVSQLSTPRVSKPAPTSTPFSSSRSSTKIGNGSSLSKSKNFSAGERKKVAPKSLHMSLNVGPSSSEPVSLTTTRKSLIMEKMGDKDIVKRAFKTFQNNYYQLKSNEERSPAPQQSAEPRVSTLMNPRKENAGSYKAAGVEKNYTKVAPCLALKSNEREEKRTEFSKKLEEKSNAREEERPRLQSKSKEDKEVEVKKVRQGLSSKATLTPSLYRGQKISKGFLNKEGLKNEMHR